MPIEDLQLSEDPEEAAQQYLKLRQYARETFQSFLRNLNSKSLRWLEQQFEDNDGELDLATFLEICPKVFPKPRYAEFPWPDQQEFIVALAGKMLFEDIDVDRSGGADWMEFVEFVCAIAEMLRIQAEEGSSTQFDFRESTLPLPYRPQITKCLYDQMFYWRDHPADSVVIFEEGQAGFHLHRPNTFQRKRRCDGHRSDLLAAAYMPGPFEWCVTSGNDKQVCFWDSAFNLVKKWKMPKHTVSTLCWCPEIKVLYYGTEHSSKIQAWRIQDIMKVRESEEPFEAVKKLELKTGHTKAVQAVLWMNQLQCVATASLDASVRIFDLVQNQRIHELKGHTKGLTCLEYCKDSQILLSGGFDNVISMWDPGAGIQFHALRGHECSITGIQAVPDTEHEIMSVDLHSVVKLWDIRRLACVQSFHVNDPQAEKSGEVEPLDPRALCMMSRDRFVVSGRRMVCWERDASQPQLTADSPIMVIVFSTRKFEIATCVKNNIRVWCALTGSLLTVHNNVVEGNITAMSLGLGERRCFVGSDGGKLNAVNFACGAHLKTLTSHKFEVTEIQCIPGKVLTLSVGDKLIMVHDDTNPTRANVLKTIDISSAGTMLRMYHDGEKIVAGGNEEGEVFWFALDFAKQVSNTNRCEVKHKAPVNCVRYLKTVPLLCTSDSESNVIFWSLQPLRSFEFFTKLELEFVTRKDGSQGSPASLASQGSAAAGAVGITSLALSWPDEEVLIIGTETGTLACISIQSIVEKARVQRDEITARKEQGEAADVISGRIFDSMEKPCDSLDYVYTPENMWLVERAHRGSVDQIIYCKHSPPVILTLGFDVRVCLWHPLTGEALGTLEQGLSEGLAYERHTKWRFPINAHLQVEDDLKKLAAAVVPLAGEEEDESKASSEDGKDVKAGKDGTDQGKKKDDAASTTGKEGSEKGVQKKQLTRSESSPAGLVAGAKQSAFKLNGIEYPDYSKTVSRLIRPMKPQDHDWFAGPLGLGSAKSSGQLPTLSSGCRRTGDKKQQTAVVTAARHLSQVLASLDGKKFDSSF